MKVFKFGGASLKSADAIRNMVAIVKQHQHEKLIVVVSAMGKSTNALEGIIKLALDGKNYTTSIKEFEVYHNNLISELLSNHKEIALQEVKLLYKQLNLNLSIFESNEFSKYYDSIVSIGELVSSTIIHHCLVEGSINSRWLDARKCIKTDNTFQDGKVDWSSTKENITEQLSTNEAAVFLTQGFIGSNSKHETTTLGREGSDYTAAIFAKCLNAESVTIWKDVPGILNADPKIIHDAILFNELPYNEASEMTFYGAKVIHPKTIKPLANQHIPLHVRCFATPNKEGTIIHDCEIGIMPPVIIYKENQCLVSFKAKDFSFVNGQGLSVIFAALHELDLNIHIMQNSAISFSACMDYNQQKIEKLIAALKNTFSIRYNTNLHLVTIKNYNEEALKKYKPKGDHLLEQISRNNYRCLVNVETIK